VGNYTEETGGIFHPRAIQHATREAGAVRVGMARQGTRRGGGRGVSSETLAEDELASRAVFRFADCF